ncbi:5'-methylthioadenosine/adenosylhomocysteine nucleosidase [Amorphus orientalis]|uniref:adenosylhomocysteine nucleosidase n=1 Tax=Amorphus orientalis TaxID=649198 RepID=A0AAE3VS16_9HYPH|nr:5'-methylthioadenosine/adenosylhomocysteine nucleosidase [Amorphus orientalis]MDQ0316765.1 adenosylhomocysteine nucleosidase [Amorphus orientalis]
MTIAIQCAIPQELAVLRAELDCRDSVEIAHLRFDHGTLFGRDVVLVGTGIGKVNTAMVATLLIDRFKATTIVFSGVAGGLDPDLAIGDVVIAEKLLQHDFGWFEAEELKVYQAGHLPFFNATEKFGFDLKSATRARIASALEGIELPAMKAEASGGAPRAPKVVFGTVLSGDQYVNCETTRGRLFQTHGGRAVEMEGAALAQVAEMHDVEWVVVRALSDLAGTESRFDFNDFVDAVSASSARIMERILPVL